MMISNKDNSDNDDDIISGSNINWYEMTVTTMIDDIKWSQNQYQIAMMTTLLIIVNWCNWNIDI